MFKQEFLLLEIFLRVGGACTSSQKDHERTMMLWTQPADSKYESQFTDSKSLKKGFF